MTAHSFLFKTNFIENVWSLFAALLLVSHGSAASPNVQNARNLVQKSLEAGERNEVRLRSYVSRSHTDLKQLSPEGTVKSEESKTFDDVIVGGYHIRSLIARDDKPLSPSDRKKEEARLARLVSQRKGETPQARDKRVNDAREKVEKDHRFSHELLNAFDYRFAGEESIEGRKAWILEATPHPGYEPKELKAQMFPHLRGRLWIDQEDLLWVKAEADVMDQLSIGFSMIAKLNPGGHIAFQQTRLPDGTWVASRVQFRGSGRVALVKHFSVDSLTTSTDFRKVPDGRRIAEGKEDF